MLEFKHKHAKSAWITLRIDRGGQIAHVLIVETDLLTSSDNPAYDEEAISSLANEIVEFMKDHPHIDRADVVPIG